MGDNLTSETIDGVLVFRFRGNIEFDTTGDLKTEILSTLLEERASAAIFDMTDADYIDSMGIGMFVHLHVQHRDRIKFLFCGLRGSVSRAFGYVKLISFFDIKHSLEEALEELGIDQL